MEAIVALWLASHHVTFALTEQAGAWRAAMAGEVGRVLKSSWHDGDEWEARSVSEGKQQPSLTRRASNLDANSILGHDAEVTRIAFWVDHVPASAWADFAAATGGERVESGENVVLSPTDDSSVFFGVRSLGDPPLPTVSPLQLYLDLLRLGDIEAAAALYEHELVGRFVTGPV